MPDELKGQQKEEAKNQERHPLWSGDGRCRPPWVRFVADQKNDGKYWCGAGMEAIKSVNYLVQHKVLQQEWLKPYLSLHRDLKLDGNNKTKILLSSVDYPLVSLMRGHMSKMIINRACLTRKTISRRTTIPQTGNSITRKSTSYMAA